MAQGRAQGIGGPADDRAVAHPDSKNGEEGSWGPKEGWRSLDWEHPRIAAVLTSITDEDYRCIWRPCHAFEESAENEEGEEVGTGEKAEEGKESCAARADPGDTSPGSREPLTPGE